MRPTLDLNYRILYAVGLWPLEAPPKLTGSHVLRYLLPRVVAVRLVYSPVFHLLSLRASWDNTAVRIEEVMALISMFSIATKFGTMFVHRRRVAALFATLARLNDARVQRVDAKECDAIRRRADRLCHRLTKVWLTTIVCLGVVMLFALFTEALHTRSIPTRRWLPYDYSQSPLLELTAVVSLLLEAVDVLLVCVADALFIVVVLQAVAQFRMLRYRLANIDTLVQKRVCRTHRDHKSFRCLKRVTQQVDPETCLPAAMVDVDVPIGDVGPGGCNPRLPRDARVILVGGDGDGDARRPDVAVDVVDRHEVRLMRKIDAATHQYMARCVNDHLELITLTHEIQSIFGKMLTSQLLFNAFLAAFALYVAMAPQIDTLHAVAVLACAGGMAQLLAYCACAHSLTEESEGVRSSAYDCDWPDASERFKGALRLVMCRADRPLRLRAAGLPLNMNTFRMVARITWHLFRVVLKIANGEKINERRS